MFSHLTCLFALLPMLLHSILGCCWHHAHECRCEVEGSRIVCPAGADFCGQTHQMHDSYPSLRPSADREGSVCGTDEHPENPCHRVPCDEEHCPFVDTVVLAAPVGFDLELFMTCAAFVTCNLSVPHAGHAAVQRFSEENAPFRSDGERRALTQVWRI